MVFIGRRPRFHRHKQLARRFAHRFQHGRAPDAASRDLIANHPYPLNVVGLSACDKRSRRQAPDALHIPIIRPHA
jgi:hypothetical protein